MEAVGSRSHGHVDHSARCLAELRRERRSLDLELLNRVDDGLNDLSRILVEPQDPVTFAAVTFVLVAATLLATYIPARRAARVDPIAALRDE